MSTPHRQPLPVVSCARGIGARLRRWVLSTLALPALLLGAHVAPARAEVALHAFNWPYATVEARAAEIAERGYRAVLVAPPLRSQGSAWWARYQPQDYRVIDHPLGDTESFVRMQQALRDAGVRLYADIVLNHMANESGWRSDLNYPGSAVLAAYAADPARYARLRLFGDLRWNFLSQPDFGPSVCIDDYDNVWKVQNWRLCGDAPDVGLPDLVANDWVVAQQQQYLRSLKALGVTGFRIDAAKHMSNAHLNRVLTPDIRSGVHVFGEIIVSGGAGDSGYDRFLAPYLAETGHSAYDFPLFESIRRALRFGGSMNQLVDPGAYGQALPGSRAVTFAVTHDIPNNGIFRYLILDPVDERLAYAYLLGRDGGMPLVYTDQNESGDGRWTEAWQRADLAAMIRFHNAAHGSDMRVLSHSDCHLLFRRGDRGLVGINKCGGSVDAWVDMAGSATWWYANYRDVLDPSSVVNVQSRWHRFVLPPRQARLWLRE